VPHHQNFVKLQMQAVRVVCSPFPATRGFMMLVAMSMMLGLWLLLTKTRVGLVIQAALDAP
jgi:branched-chain amino acid transport system permease protein